jgi:hypothetical protein
MVLWIQAGTIAGVFPLRFAELSSEPRSLDAILRANLEPAEIDAADIRPITASDRAEHLALIARWFYSKPREGEIFFRDKAWPYRRMVRACSRVLAGPTPPLPPKPPAVAPPTD